MAVVEKYNYKPNYAASSLRTGNSRTFGDNCLLAFLPAKIQSLPQQVEGIAEKALQLALSVAKGIHVNPAFQ